MASIIFMKQGRDVGPGEHFCPLQGKVVGKVGAAAYQAPLSMGFSRQKYWSGVPLPSPAKALAKS